MNVDYMPKKETTITDKRVQVYLPFRLLVFVSEHGYKTVEPYIYDLEAKIVAQKKEIDALKEQLNVGTASLPTGQ